MRELSSLLIGNEPKAIASTDSSKKISHEQCATAILLTKIFLGQKSGRQVAGYRVRPTPDARSNVWFLTVGGHHRNATSQRGNHPVPISCRAHRAAMKTTANTDATAVRLQKIYMAHRQCAG